MKRPISCALALIIIFSCTQGGFVSRAEEVEVASTQVEEAAELASEIDAEGLTIELDEIEAEDAIPEAGEEEAEAEAVATRAALYARVEKLTEIFDAPEGGVIATLEQGGVALVLDAAEWTRIAFDTPRGTVTGYVAADRLTLLDDAETGTFLDQLIASEAVTLYDGDLDRPLATLECAFPEAESGDAEAPAEEPAGESIPEPSEEPTAEPSEEPSAEPTAEPSEEPSAEPTVEIVEAETPEPTAEPAETVEPTGTPEPVVTPAPTEEVVIASADELGTLDKMFAAAGFAIEQSASTVAVGGSCTISAVNANGAAIGSSELTYGSSNESVAKVSDSGVVSGIAPGSVNITVTYNSNTLYSAVQVLAAPSAVKLPTKLLLGVKEQGARLTPVLVPIAGQTACAPVTYTWSSSNRKVVAIDAKTGVMKAKRKGTATITVTTSNGKKAKCKVYVRKAPGKVTLSPKSVKLSAGGMKFKLTAKLPKSTGGTVSYTSSNTRVATVAADGTITTVGKGSAVITARTFNGKTSKCTVNVTDVPSTASFAATTRVLPATVSFSPSVSVKAADGSDAAANLSFVVTSGANCVNIGSNGSITGVKTGTAVITGITHNGVRTGNSCTITVVAAPSSVSLNKAKMSMGKGQTYRLTPMLGNVSGAGLTLTWKSSKSKVATVDATGLVTAKSTGSATITVKTANGKTAKCKVTVKKAPKKVSLKPAKATLNVGASDRFTVKLPKGAAGGCTFSSSNTAVATVTNDGVVTGVSAGTAIITVTTYNGKTARATLTVKAASSGSTSSSSSGSSSVSVPASLQKLGLASYQNTFSAGMTREQKIEYVIYNAQNQLGKPYIYGSGYKTANPKGFDCSGLVYWCYYKLGIKLGNSAYKQGYDSKYTKITSISDLKRGDVVCFNTVSDSDLCDHTGIYLGNGYFIHASSGKSKMKVIVQRFTNDSISYDYYKRNFSWGRRIL